MLYGFDGKRPTAGSGTYISETATVIGDVRIGKNCYIGHGAVLRGDYGTIEIGDKTAVEEGVVVHAPPGGLCSIGARVIVGHGAIIHAARIDDSAAIGMGAVVSIKSDVGAGAIIAEGAVVKQGQKVPALVMAAGNPARKIRDVSEEEREHWRWATDLYADLAGKYLEQGMERIG